MDAHPGVRLALHVVGNTMPQVITWMTMQWDISMRGLCILAGQTLLTMAITTSAFLDKGLKSNDTDPTPPDSYHSPDPFAGRTNTPPARHTDGM